MLRLELIKDCFMSLYYNCTIFNNKDLFSGINSSIADIWSFDVADLDSGSKKTVDLEEFSYLVSTHDFYKRYTDGYASIISCFSDKGRYLCENMVYVGCTPKFKNAPDWLDFDLQVRVNEMIGSLLYGQSVTPAFVYGTKDVINIHSCGITNPAIIGTPTDRCFFGCSSDIVSKDNGNIFDFMINHKDLVLNFGNRTIGVLRECYTDDKFDGYCILKFKYNMKVLLEAL